MFIVRGDFKKWKGTLRERRRAAWAQGVTLAHAGARSRRLPHTALLQSCPLNPRPIEKMMTTSTERSGADPGFIIGGRAPAPLDPRLRSLDLTVLNTLQQWSFSLNSFCSVAVLPLLLRHLLRHLWTDFSNPGIVGTGIVSFPRRWWKWALCALCEVFCVSCYFYELSLNPDFQENPCASSWACRFSSSPSSACYIATKEFSRLKIVAIGWTSSDSFSHYIIPLLQTHQTIILVFFIFFSRGSRRDLISPLCEGRSSTLPSLAKICLKRPPEDVTLSNPSLAEIRLRTPSPLMKRFCTTPPDRNLPETPGQKSVWDLPLRRKRFYIPPGKNLKPQPPFILLA